MEILLYNTKHQRVIFKNVFGVNTTQHYIFVFLDLISRFKKSKSLYENLNIYVNNKFPCSMIERKATN